jgi:hypothetical protein
MPPAPATPLARALARAASQHGLVTAAQAASWACPATRSAD